MTPSVRVAVVAIFVLGAGLRVGNLGNVSSRSPDERVYTRQARVVLENGAAGLRGLVEEYLRDPELRFYPPPTRVGYIRLLAAFMRVSGTTDERAGAYLSCAASIGSLALLLLFGLRFLPAPATLAAGLLFAVSPMELALARRTWQDALVEFLGFSLVFLAAEFSRNPDRRAWLVPYVVLGSVGIVVKELAPVAYALVTLRVLWVLFVRRRDLKGGALLAGAGLAGAAAAVGWLAAAVGGISTLWKIVRGIPAANAANSYAIEYQTGPPWRVLETFWIVTPAAAVFCLVGVAVLLLARLRLVALPEPAGPRLFEAGWWTGVFLLSFLALPMVLPHWVNLRYVSVAYGPFYLLAGIGVWFLLESAGPVAGVERRAVAAGGVAVLLIAASADLLFFERVVVERGLADLSIRLLLEATAAGPAVPGLESVETEATRAGTPEAYLNLSLVYSRAGAHLKSIEACREALRLRPDYAEAYNNMAAAYESLAMWEEAIGAAREALRIRPDFQLARNNLEWSVAQKRLRDDAGARRVPTVPNAR